MIAVTVMVLTNVDTKLQTELQTLATKNITMPAVVMVT